MHRTLTPFAPLRPASLLAAGLILYAALSPVLAHSGATGVIKERMDAMSDIGKQVKFLAAMVKKERAFDADQAAKAAERIAAHADKMSAQFPKGSLKHPSEALPAIWLEWDRFVELARKLETDAKLLASEAAKAETAQQIFPALKAVGATCKTCHEAYRKPK